MRARFILIHRDGTEVRFEEGQRVVTLVPIPGSNIRRGMTGTVEQGRCGLLGVRFDEQPKSLRLIAGDTYIPSVCRVLEEGDDRYQLPLPFPQTAPPRRRRRGSS